MSKPADWAHCEHYDLGPTDPDGVALCNTCHSAVQLRVMGMPLSQWEDQKSTVVAQEGDDVPFNWPGEG